MHLRHALVQSTARASCPTPLARRRAPRLYPREYPQPRPSHRAQEITGDHSLQPSAPQPATQGAASRNPAHRSLDTSVKPRTLSPTILEIRAPCWEIPGRSVEIPAACLPGVAAPMAEAAHAAAPGPRLCWAAAEQRCSICMESFVTGERVRRLPCNLARSNGPRSRQSYAAFQRSRGQPARLLRATYCAEPRALAAWLPTRGSGGALALGRSGAHPQSPIPLPLFSGRPR